MKAFLFQKQFKTRFIMLVVIISLLILSPAAQVKASTSKLADPSFPLEEEQSFLKKTALNNNDTPPDGFQRIDSRQIETFKITSPQLGGKEKSIVIYLPSEYNSSRSSYPVTYLQDPGAGLIIYQGTTDTWLINSSRLEFYTKDFEKEAIVVIIEADSNYNWDEYGPWVKDDMYSWINPLEANQVVGGNGDLYIDFLVQTLKPEIDNRYRTLADRENTAGGGYKMGGLIALYAVLTRPEVFSKETALSPAVWFGESGGPWLSNNRLLELIETNKVPLDIKIRLDVTSEDRIPSSAASPNIYDSLGKRLTFTQAYLEGTRAVVKALINKGLPLENIRGGIENPEEWTESFSEPAAPGREISNGFFTYLPIIFKPIIPPQIISDSETTFYTDSTNTFTIVTTGDPLPEITFDGDLPEGVDLTVNTNGTAILSGRPNVSDASIFQISISADNGSAQPATQLFTLRIADPDTLTCPDANSCIVKFNMHMTALNRDRDIWVYLPPNYDPEANINYQVIYLTSAQSIFSVNAWDFASYLDFLYEKNNNKGTIAVAVAYDENYKWDEYSAWDNNYMYDWIKLHQNFDGKGDALLSFIVDELKPTIDSRYRTLPDRDHTAIGGGSRFALFALYAGLEKPDVFSKIMAMSPAIWVANNSRSWLVNNGFINWFGNHTAPGNVRYYLYVGTEEWIEKADPFLTTGEDWPTIYLEGVNITKSKLEDDGVPSSNNLKYIYSGGASWPPAHDPSTWSHYIDDSLVWLGFYTTNRISLFE